VHIGGILDLIFSEKMQMNFGNIGYCYSGFFVLSEHHGEVDAELGPSPGLAWAQYNNRQVQ
jgi:hypothetical protein